MVFCLGIPPSQSREIALCVGGGGKEVLALTGESDKLDNGRRDGRATKKFLLLREKKLLFCEF